MSDIVAVQLQVDRAEIMRMASEQIEAMLRATDNDLVFWDACELRKRTCMSWNFIQEQFFFDPRCPKHKVGAKWYFPAREMRAFLEQWLREQRR